MTRRIEGLAALTLLCIASACRTEEPQPPPAAPVIEFFTSDRAEILPGESTLLRFTVANADEVSIVTADGDQLTIEGNASVGSAEVSPRESSIFVLRAKGPGGRAAAFVQVAVGEPLASVFLMSVPPEVDPGEQVDLVWSAQGAKAVELKSSLGELMPLTGTSGVVPLAPEQSAQYTLTATGPDDAKKTATTTVRVRPQLELLTAAPGLVNAGDVLQFTWKAQGADALVITEKTFGDVYRSSSASNARLGTHGWTIPTTYPGTETALLTGFRLEFTVTLTSQGTDTKVTRTIVRHLGQGPVIHTFIAPEMATTGKDLELSWEVSGAERIQILANGLLVSEPRAADMSTLQKSSVVLPAPSVTTRYELLVTGFAGASAAASKVVTVTQPPQVTQFNVTADIAKPGDAATATWKTVEATQMQIRIENGPVVFSTSEASRVSSGTTSLFPGRTTTYVLEAFNAAGDLVRSPQRRTVTVASPANVVVTPSHPVPGDVVSVTWDLPQGEVAEVLGAPGQEPERRSMSGSFVDLTMGVSGKLEFANADDSVAELPASAAFSFPMAGALRSRFVVSTNGFVAFEPSDSMPVNALVLPTRERVPALLAPLWDDLQLGGGEVLYRVDRSQVPGRLIIQWNDVQLKDDPTSKLKFQVQLYETGEARFVYNTLEKGAALAADGSATIGLNHDATLGKVFAADRGGSVAVGDEILWANRLQASGTFSIPLYASTHFSLFYRRTTGELVNVSVPVTVWSADTLSIREAMPQPLVETTGQWIELVNTGREPLSLAGLNLSTLSGGFFPLPDWITLEPGQVWIVGQSADLFETDGVTVDFVIPELSLQVADEVKIETATALVSTLAWTESTVGVSVEREQRVVNSSGLTKTCPRSATYGSNGAQGTPGVSNEPCWDYLLEPIAYAPTDILNSGEVLFQTPYTGFGGVVKQLTVRPLRLFGKEYNQVFLGQDGFLSVANESKSDAGYFPEKPQVSNPNAAIVPFGQSFWMRDLTGDTTRGPAYVLWRRVEAGELQSGSVGHYVMQWHRGSTVSDYAVDVSYQVKLFDDGVVEIHYGLMKNGTKSTAYGEGEDAASWIENETGTEALVINTNSRTPGIHSYTAFRFSPL